MPRSSAYSLASLMALAILCPPVPAAETQGVQVTQGKESVRVEINGELFTEYFFTGKSHPWVAPGNKTAAEDAIAEARPNLPKHVYFYPVLGPGGARMTRDWPMKDVATE